MWPKYRKATENGRWHFKARTKIAGDISGVIRWVPLISLICFLVEAYFQKVLPMHKSITDMQNPAETNLGGERR